MKRLFSQATLVYIPTHTCINASLISQDLKKKSRKIGSNIDKVKLS